MSTGFVRLPTTSQRQGRAISSGWFQTRTTCAPTDPSASSTPVRPDDSPWPHDSAVAASTVTRKSDTASRSSPIGGGRATMRRRCARALQPSAEEPKEAHARSSCGCERSPRPASASLEAVDDLRALFGLRVWRQHAGTEDRAARGVSRLGISLPVYECGAARQHMQSRTVAALSAGREEAEHWSRPPSSPLPGQAVRSLSVGSARRTAASPAPVETVVHEAHHGTPSCGWRQSCHPTSIVRRPGRDVLGKARSGQCRDRRLGL